MWVKVWVEDNDGVRSIEVDTNATSSRGQKVDKNFRSGLIEFVDTLLPERARRVTILRGTISGLENKSEHHLRVEDA